MSEWAHFSSYDVGIRSGSSASHILVCIVAHPFSFSGQSADFYTINVECQCISSHFKKYITI